MTAIKLYYGWIILALASLTMVACWGIQFSFGIFLKPLINEFGWTLAGMSGVFSVYMIARGISSLLMGWLSDRHGIRLVVAIGTTCVVAGSFLISRTDAVWQLYIYYGVMIGIGTGSLYAPLASMLSRWFVARRGLVLGIFSTGMGVGTIVFSSLAEHFISTYTWRTSYSILALVATIIVLPGVFLIRHDPEEMGLLAYGSKARGQANRESRTQNYHEQGVSFRNATKTVSFWTLFIIMVTSYVATVTPMVHVVPLAIDRGISSTVAATILAMIGAFSILGRLIVGAVADRIGAKNALPMTFITMAIALLFLTMADNVVSFYLFAVIFGFAYGACVPILLSVIAEYFGGTSAGVNYGFLLSGGMLGGALGPFVVGLICDMTKSYSFAFIFVGVMAIMAGIFSIYLRTLKPCVSSATLGRLGS